jgi:hypothetical protein
MTRHSARLVLDAALAATLFPGRSGGEARRFSALQREAVAIASSSWVR